MLNVAGTQLGLASSSLSSVPANLGDRVDGARSSDARSRRRHRASPLGGLLRLVSAAPGSVMATEQELEELLLRHRGRDQRALAEVATHRHQGLQLHLTLDPLGDRRAAKPMCEIDDGLTDGSIGGFKCTIADEIRA